MPVGTERTEEADRMEKLVELRHDITAFEAALQAASMKNSVGMDVDAIVRYEVNAQKMALRLAKAREDYTNALREVAIAELQNEAGPANEAE